MDAIIRGARECHTKQAWEALFAEFGETIASAGQSRPIAEIFRLLQSDEQSLQYSPTIWGQLIQGCLSSWNHELGREIVETVRKIPSTAIAIPATRLQLETGHPAAARELANRALRLAGLTPKEKLQLEMLICNSHAEEGKHTRALRLLNQMAPAVRDPQLAAGDRADFVMQIGRLQFFLGRYSAAGEFFHEAANLMLGLSDWEGAAKALFNTAACYHNSGGKRQEQAFAFVEQCRRIAETHDLPGPISHCESFYGLDAYQHGNFAGARDHFRRALDYLPAADKSFRRLHILSMLSYAYLAQGRYQLAKNFGRQTIDLAALDESEHLKTRYICLDAELNWEDGQIEASQKLLHDATAPLSERGIHNLEELSALNRYSVQSALLGATSCPIKASIDEHLRKDHYPWLGHVVSEGMLLINQDRLDEAKHEFEDCLLRARRHGDRQHEALGLLGIIQCLLRARRVKKVESVANEFEVAVARIGETPLKAHVQIIGAARAYQEGRFEDCTKLLRVAAKSPRISFVDQFNVSVCLATIEGRSPRLLNGWQVEMFARFARTHFAPTLEAVDARLFRVGMHYPVSLERHPALADLLHYLLRRSSFSAQTAEVQTEVWKQSINSQGWEQKIRNAIMRLRDLFPWTIAPIILHSDNVVSLFHEAITVSSHREAGTKPEAEILRLIADAPMSSMQLSNRLSISSATTKRILKKLSDESEVTAIKAGRNVFYSAQKQKEKRSSEKSTNPKDLN